MAAALTCYKKLAKCATWDNPSVMNSAGYMIIGSTMVRRFGHHTSVIS